MQPNDALINHLISTDCLSIAQAMSIARKRYNTDKNMELLHVVRSLPLEKHLVFLDYLHFTEQRNVADVIENGGVTIRVVVKARNNVDILVDELKNIKRQTDSRQELRAIGLRDVYLLEMLLDRSIVLWLWCRTKDALENLRIMLEGNYLHTSISTLLHSLINSDKIVVHVDSKQLQKHCIVRRMSAKLRGNLLCPFGKNLLGVCSLQDKIYVMSDKTIIHIYENKAPYRPLENKNLLRLSIVPNPLELVACPVQKCLYIADLRENCVWKVNSADDHQVSKWLPGPVPKLSVSNDGKILVLDDNRTHPNIKIYAPEAELEGTFPMRGHPYMYSWAAVELLPRVVAVPYTKFDRSNSLKGIVIMRLNETGDILRDVQSERIFRLAPYSAGRLLAAYEDTNEVILLDDQLQPLQVIISKEKRGFQWPRCFCYRKDTRELIFNQLASHDHQLNVYQLNYDDEC